MLRVNEDDQFIFNIRIPPRAGVIKKIVRLPPTWPNPVSPVVFCLQFDFAAWYDGS